MIFAAAVAIAWVLAALVLWGLLYAHGERDAGT